MTDQTKAIVRKAYEAVNARDLDAFNEIFDDNMTMHGWEASGREMLKEKFRGLLDAFPDAAITLEDLVVEGDRAAARITFRGTHTKEFEGIPASNSAVESVEMDFFRLDGGKIVEGWVLYDNLGFLQQVGALPESETASA